MFLGAIGALLAAQAGLAYSTGWMGIAGALLLFFAGFNYLEASLPALISRAAPVESKGPAMGIYSSVQFLGAFVGASAGGLICAAFRPSLGIRLLRCNEPDLGCGGAQHAGAGQERYAHL